MNRSVPNWHLSSLPVLNNLSARRVRQALQDADGKSRAPFVRQIYVAEAVSFSSFAHLFRGKTPASKYASNHVPRYHSVIVNREE
jgi:hypothetical protein